jgi:hypothetical protein
MELHRDQADKFFSEVDMLEQMLEHDLDEDTVELALSQAKRVRREGNLVVRALARLRDQLQP